MKSILQAFSALAISAAGISCSNEITVNLTPAPDGVKTISEFTAEPEYGPATKLKLDKDGTVSWGEDEFICVFSDTDDVQSFWKDKGGNVFRNNTPVSGKEFFAYYPGDSAFSVDPDNRKVLIYSTYGEGICLPNHSVRLPMTAKSRGPTLSFKHAAGLLHISVKGTQRIKEIRVQGNLKEMLCGNAYIDMDEDIPVMKFREYLSWRTECYCQTNTKLSEDKPLDVYFVLPPMTFENGFSVIMTLDDKEVSKSTNKRVTIERGMIKSFSVIDVNSVIQEEEDAILAEREALVAFYNALDGPNWIDNTNWCSDKPVGEWSGVTVNDAGRVRYMVFQSNGLKGELPEEIGAFTELEQFIIQDELVYGSLPASIANWKRIENLFLCQNRLGGAFPPVLRKLKLLTTLVLTGAVDYDTGERLDYEYLSGPLPEWIGELSKLQFLELSGNYFSGEIPKSLNQLKDLHSLDLGANLFSGPLPDLSGMNHLTSIFLQGNFFSGSVPAEYAKLMDNDGMLNFWFFNNNLSGWIPEEIVRHPNFAEFAYMFLANQRPGYQLLIDDTKVPACRHVFKTFSGDTLNLGKLYSKADYTLIVRWAEWCNPSKLFIPVALNLAHKYMASGLQTVWAYAGGNETARKDYMSTSGLDKEKYHIVESTSSDCFSPASGDHAVWMNWLGYGTPFVEVVNRDGYIVFIDDAEPYTYYRSYSFSHERGDLASFLSKLFD